MNDHGAQNKQQNRSSGGDRWMSPILWLGLHVVGVLAVAAAIGAWILPGAHLDLLWEAGVGDGELGQSLVARALVHVGFAAVIWCGLAMLVESAWHRRHRVHRRRAMQRSRGSVLVEFLAVFPVFMLLTFGLIQLTIINIGGALARVAAYEGARTVWIWNPEVGVHDQVSEAVVLDRARTAVALVMTPVAPGDFMMDDSDVTEDFERLRDAMTVRFQENLMTSSGNKEVSPSIDLNLTPTMTTLAIALDSSDIRERAYRKLTFSYLSTVVDTDLVTDDVEGIVEIFADPDDPEDWDQIGLHFQYYQHMAMPFVDGLFGQPHPSPEIAQRGGKYFVWDVEFTLPPQRHRPNREVP